MKKLILAAALTVPGALRAQIPVQPVDRPPESPTAAPEIPSEAYAVRAADGTPDVDGRLDDEVWRFAPVLSEFLQREPVEGAAPSESTAVKFAFTDRSLYVAVRAYDSEPDKVYGRLMRRDQRAAADNISIFIDSYYDRRTSFEFNVNASGSRRDVFIYNDGAGRDDSWDPVYDWATSVDSLGWIVEMRIPLSQLRFTARDSVVFGVRVRRFIYRKNEDMNWPFFPRDAAGEASQYADLVGFGPLPAPRRAELLPYTSGTAAFAPQVPGNPFETGRSGEVRFGADGKFGITSGLTLDATVNPDFGQVEGDAAEVNLTEFESFFPEKRPFFIEGTNLFQFSLSPPNRTRFGFSFGGREGLVYTRRIGRPPQVPAFTGGGFANGPRQSTIIGAGKLSGQIGGGWGVGIMQAVTQKEYAEVVDSAGVRGSYAVEPLSGYTVVRAQRQTGQGRVSYGGIWTATLRRLDEEQFDRLHEQAFSGGADLNLRFGQFRYELSAAAMGSRVQGSAEALSRTQTSSARYFQRPDADYVEFIPGRTSLSGYSGYLRLAKVTGFFTWRALFSSRSPGFETNDIGFLNRADVHHTQGRIDLRWLRPGSLFRRFEWRFQGDLNYSYGWERTRTEVQTRLAGEFLNYWNLNLTAQVNFPALSTRLLRGGLAFAEPGRARLALGGRTDWRKPVWVDGNVSYTREDVTNVDIWSVRAGFAVRPPGPFSMRISGRGNWALTDRQYLTARAVDDSTYYMFGRLDRQEYSLELRVDLALTPRLSLEFYGEPFVSAGTYGAFRFVDKPRAEQYQDRLDPLGDRLSRPGNGEPMQVDANGDGEVDFIMADPDFTFLSFRTNTVLRWEFKPGSTLFLVWQQDKGQRFSEGTIDNPWRSLGDAFSTPGVNVFVLKLSYWLGL